MIQRRSGLPPLAAIAGLAAIGAIAAARLPETAQAERSRAPSRSHWEVPTAAADRAPRRPAGESTPED